MEKHFIMGVHVTDRLQQAVEVQKLLTESGAYIKTRLGLHEIGAASSAPNGLLILEMVSEDNFRALESKLNAFDGIEVQTMVFDHP